MKKSILLSIFLGLGILFSIPNSDASDMEIIKKGLLLGGLNKFVSISLAENRIQAKLISLVFLACCDDDRLTFLSHLVGYAVAVNLIELKIFLRKFLRSMKNRTENMQTNKVVS